MIDRLEVDGDAAAVESGVDASGADEGRKAVNGRILKDNFGQLLLLLFHAVKGDGLRCLGDALNHPCILHREKALGNGDVEEDGGGQRG